MAREYTNIADAISAVNDEVSAQTTQIADILTALEGKSGGGLPQGITEIKTGEITLAQNYTSSSGETRLNFEHGLSQTPKNFVVLVDSFTDTSVPRRGNTFYFNDGIASYGDYFTANSDAANSYNTGWCRGVPTESKIYVNAHSSYPFRLGTKLKWIAWA